MKLGLMFKSIMKFSTLFKSLGLCITLAIIFSCNSSEPIQINGFDSKAWKSKKMIDSNNCLSYRKEKFNLLYKNQTVFLGKTDQELIDFLGNPDSENLNGRLKKSKMYCIDGCNPCDKKEYTRFLVFDFETFKRLKSMRIVVEFNKI